MNRILKCLILITGLISFIGCQKELTFTDTPVVPPVTPGVDDSTLLVKYYQLDSLSASQIDTGIFAHFYYDNSKRLAAIIVTSSSDTAINDTYYERNAFFYQNADTLPYKMILYSTLGGSPMEVDTVFYAYNAAGKLVVDSSIYGWTSGLPDVEVTSYKYAGNNVEVTRPSNDVDNVSQVFQNGNLKTQHSTNSSGSSSDVSDFSYTYDTHVNPFYLPALYGTRAVGEFDDGIPAVLQKNNCTSLNFTYGTQNRSVQATYVYKQNGYPSAVYQVAHSNDPSGGTEYAKGVFIYGR